MNPIDRIGMGETWGWLVPHWMLLLVAYGALSAQLKNATNWKGAAAAGLGNIGAGLLGNDAIKKNGNERSRSSR